MQYFLAYNTPWNKKGTMFLKDRMEKKITFLVVNNGVAVIRELNLLIVLLPVHQVTQTLLSLFPSQL